MEHYEQIYVDKSDNLDEMDEFPPSPTSDCLALCLATPMEYTSSDHY